jgi:hypothetical protein
VAAIVVAVGAGVNFIVSGSVRYFEHASLAHHAAKADGRILSIRHTSGDPCGGAEVSTVFRDASGDSHTVRIVEFCPPAQRVGQEVSLIYDRTQPTHAESPTYWSDSDSAVGVVLDLLIGLGLVAVPTGLLIWQTRRHRKHPPAEGA